MLIPLFTAFSIFFSPTLSAQKTIDNPIVAGTNSDYILVKTVELTPDSTVFQMEINCYEGLEYTLHEKNSIHAFKMITKNKVYPLQSITITKPGVISCDMMSVQYFHLVFEALPEETELVNLQEGDRSESDLYFENILLLDFDTAVKKAKEGNAKYQRLLAKHYEHQYDYETAQEYLNMYLDQIVKEEGTQSPNYLEALSSQIQLNLNIGNYLEAEEISLQTLETIGRDNPQAAGILYTLGDVYQVLGKHEEAVDNYIQYLRAMEKGSKLKSATYSMINNLVMYSWANMTDTLDRQPLLVGVAVNPEKLEEGKAQMRIYAVGATEYMIAKNENFENSEWKVYDAPLMTEEDITPQTKVLYIRFKDSKNKLSDVYTINLE